jgi:uncharacterized protein YdeI (YjbR/CyaY-like superfamily)
MKGVFKIPVSAERRTRIHAAAGDAVRVSMVLHATPSKVDVPTDLAEALTADQDAAHFFSGLTASQQKGFIVPIKEAKTAETRARRIERAMTALKARRKRP